MGGTIAVVAKAGAASLLQFKNHAHRAAASVALILHFSVICERRAFTVYQLGLAYEQMNRHAILFMLDDIPAFLAGRGCRVLALPMESTFVNPVIKIAMI